MIRSRLSVPPLKPAANQDGVPPDAQLQQAGFAATSPLMPSKAMILAAGLGERMRPLTIYKPKPLIEVCGQPIIDWCFDHLRRAGVNNNVVNLHYLGEMIEHHLEKMGEKYPNSSISFSPEKELLNTGGGVRQALPLLGEEAFFVLNADTIWLDGPMPALRRLAECWDETTMDVLLLMQPKPKAHFHDGPGDYAMDSLGRLRYRKEREIVSYVYAGVHIMHPRLLEHAPQGAFSLKKLWDSAEKEGRLYGLVHDGWWFHVGTPEALDATNNILQRKTVHWVSPHEQP
ncbi:MAG: nucleotidyltransferase family protein [Alphaproteobacteria bacterium]